MFRGEVRLAGEEYEVCACKAVFLERLEERRLTARLGDLPAELLPEPYLEVTPTLSMRTVAAPGGLSRQRLKEKLYRAFRR